MSRSKAFDIVNNILVMNKRKNACFKARAFKWFKMTLQTEHRVFIDYNKSDFLSMNKGVPTGSVLGLILLCLHI